MDDDTKQVADKAAADKAEVDRREAQRQRDMQQAQAQAAQQAAEMQRETAMRQNAEAAAKAQAERDPVPHATGAGEVHAALRGYKGNLPLPPPLVQPAVQRDHETLVAHMKAWVRREVTLATVHEMDQSAREIHNP